MGDSWTCRLSEWSACPRRWGAGIVALALLILVVVAALPADWSPDAVAEAASGATPWQLGAAPYRSNLMVGDPSITSTLTELPLKVVLTPSNFNYADASADATAADANSSALAFVMAEDAGSTQLPYYVDTWNPGGVSVIWVKVPTLTPGAKGLELYYGGTAPAGTYNGPSAASAVWSNGYTAVNLFGEKDLNYTTHSVTAATPANPLSPAPLSPVAAEAGAGKPGLPTGTEFNDLLKGVAGGATLANGGATGGADFSQMIAGNAGAAAAGQGVELSGPTTTSKGGTYMTVPGSDSVVSTSGQMTESVSVYVPAAALSDSYSYFLTQQAGKPTTGNTADLFFRFASGVLNVYGYPGKSTTTGQVEVISSAPVTAGWNTIATVVNGTTMTLYLNGAAVGTGTLPNALAEGGTTGAIYLGEHPGPEASTTLPEAAFGYDQLSFAETARSGDWMQAENESHNNELITYGSQESIATPNGVEVASAGGDSATISWEEVGEATRYLVYQGTSPGAESATPVTCASSTATSCTVVGLESGKTDYFTVTAVTPAGTSLPSEEVSYSYVAPPSGVEATAYYSGQQVQLNWAAVPGATSYSVYEGHATGAESTTPVTCAGLTATSCVVPGLGAGTAYFFTVTASSAAATSIASSEVSTTTPSTNTTGRHWQIGAAPYRLPLNATDTNLFYESLTDFPAEVVLTPSNFDYAADSTDGVAADALPTALAFVQADDSAANPTQLPYEVDTWNPGGTSILWVTLPVLPFAETERLELYYGPAAGGTYEGADAAAVWANGYTSVNQFSVRSEDAAAIFPSGSSGPTLASPLPAAPQNPAEDAAGGGVGIPTGTTFPDLLGGNAAGAALGNNGLTSGAYESNEVQGPVGGQALELTGVTNTSNHGGQYMELPGADANMSSSGQLTESTTVYVPPSALTAEYSYFLTQEPGLPVAGETADLFFRFGGGALNLFGYPIHNENREPVELVSSSPVTTGWNTIGAVVDGTSMTLYLNGVAVGTGTLPNNLVEGGGTSPIFMGQHPGTNDVNSKFPSTGFGYDQVDFSDTARSSDWMQAESQSEMNELFTYGASQSPSSPLDVSTSAGAEEGMAEVSWDSPLDPGGVTGYEVFAGQTPGGETATPIATVGAGATSAEVANLPSGTSYFKVKAETAAGDSLPSAETSYEWLVAPDAVTANDFSDSSVELNWGESAGASSYSVYEGTAPGAESTTPVTCATLTATSCVVPGLTYDKTYYFTLVGVDGRVSSVASAETTGVPGLGTAWGIPAAAERLPVVVDNLAANPSGGPVEVELPATFDYDKASETHLLFTAGEDPTALPYQVVSWNPSGTSTIRVEVPATGPGADPVYMYYDGVAEQRQSTVAQSGPTPSVGSPEYYFVTTGATIDGTPRIGQTLTADRGGFTPAAEAYSYQWRDGEVPIAGATGPTLSLDPSLLAAGAIQIGDQISVRISGRVGDVILSPQSGPVTVALGQFAPGTPTVSGPAQAGGTLVANPGTWSPAGASSYQWLLNGAPISGATTTAYTLPPADAGQEVAVAVTERTEGYADDTATSAPVTVAGSEGSAPVLGTPSIIGTVRVGESVSAEAGTWSPASSPSYQWLLDGSVVAGATGSSYAIVPADAGKQLSVEVTEDPAGVGPESATSAAYEVQSATFRPGAPSIGGSATVGGHLQVSIGSWAPAPTTVGYRWLLDGQPIRGASGAAYTVPAGDGGHQISVEVYGSTTGYETAEATTSAVMIAAEPPAPTTTPSSPTTEQSSKLTLVKRPIIHGRDAAGGKLTVGAGKWSVGAATVKYQWLRAGKAIHDATHATYKVTRADAGADLSVRLTARAPGYAPVSIVIRLAKRKS
jgi:hypothetical protein